MYDLPPRLADDRTVPSRADALERSERQLRLAEQVARLGSFDWDVRSGELYWSDQHYRLWGWEPGAVMPCYEVFRQAIHPDDVAMLEAALQQALQGGRLYDCVHRIRRADGSELDIHARGEVMFGADGQALRMIGTVQDVTEARSAQAALHTHEFALNAIADMVSVIDEQYRYRLVNDEWCRITGLAREAVIGRRPEEVLQWPFGRERGPALRACMATREPRTVRAPMEPPAPPDRWFETRYQPYVEPGGGIRGVLMVTRDVSEQEHGRLALAASLENLRRTLNATGDAIFASNADNPDEPVLFVNQPMLQMWGIPPDAAAALTPAQIIGYARPYFVDAERDVRRIGEIIASGVAQEERLLLKDGRVLLRRCIPTEDHQRQVRVWGFRDITLEAQAQQALRNARDDAERASRAKSQFLSSMSHELRTPMNAVLGFGQLLESEAQGLDERQAGWVQEILRGGRHLLSLINDLLDLARIEAGRVALSLEPVRLQELLQNCLRLVQPLAERHGIQVVLSAPVPEPALVRADRTRLKQVLLNLLGNAIKYNRPGGRVSLACVCDGNTVRISVTDTGPGLRPEECARLFQAFERLGAESSAIEGAGIGLALSRQLMLLMNGQIGVDSVVGTGSTFWLQLPSADAAAVQPPPALPRPATQQPVAGLASTLLYIEDNPVNVLLMQAMLSRLPELEMLATGDPDEGLRLARERRPDLVLLDIQLPGTDGFEVLRRLRTSRATLAIPVVAVSANAMPQDVAEGLGAGFDGYLTKPLDLTLLLATVRRMLERGQAG